MKPNIILLPEDLVSYARHGLARVDFSDIEEIGRELDGAILDVKPLNAISIPNMYWKRGTLRRGYIQRPILYIASINLDSKQRPLNALSLDNNQRLEGFKIFTGSVHSTYHAFWDIKPIYSEEKHVN